MFTIVESNFRLKSGRLQGGRVEGGPVEGGRVVVGYGQAVAVIDPATHTVLRTVPLPAHPEGFQLEQAGKSLVVRCDPEVSGPGKHTLAIGAKAADGETHRLTLTVFVAPQPPGQPEG